ncbi:DUF7010 family protein [Rheinheimera texasensis]|uniref:DUF7010 family protein n=1 Tax=Rheinheimera texasensis TaxID=306205 RepID=UPI0004E0D029|nr:hypothetical protein [Rheinheimera texasensis]
MQNHKTLDQQLIEFRSKRYLAMPLSGAIIWALIGGLSFVLTPYQQVMATFIGTGSIIYLAMAISRLTGENISFQKNTERNWFDTVFLAAVGMSFLVFAISIPLFMENYQALPFALAVQTGLMWLVFGVLAKAPVAYLHTMVRTVACVAAYLALPEHSFWLQPLIVVLCYGFTIPVLELRYRAQQVTPADVTA